MKKEPFFVTIYRMPESDSLKKFLATRADEDTPTLPQVEEPRFSRSKLLGVLGVVGVFLCVALGFSLAYFVRADENKHLREKLQEQTEANTQLTQECARLRELIETEKNHSPLTTSAPPQNAQPNSPVNASPLPLQGQVLISPALTDPIAQRLLNPQAEDWRERYNYAALKYNRIVEDYAKLRKQYLNLVGRAGKSGKLVTASQFYQILRQDIKLEQRQLDAKFSKGGLRASEYRELENKRDELRHRDWWLKKMANRHKVD